MSFELPKLEYSYDALEPYIDTQTMEIHHSKHHQGYTDKLNAALVEHVDLAEKSAEEIIANINSVPEEIKQAVKNNGGGYINHSLFWQVMGPANDGGMPDTELTGKIKSTFGGDKEFMGEFSEAAAAHFGSGWVWLVVGKNGQLQITTTVNQDSPLSDGNRPILTLDVWEHAYYLKYQNRRPEFIEAWWNVVNWEKVDDLYRAVSS